MAIKTMSASSGGSKFEEGWHQVTISKAEYGEWTGTKFIDVWFNDYPENFTLRIYAKKGKDGEEFAIGNVFRFANAGITEVIEGTGGDKVVKLDDSAENMVGQSLNIFFYKDGDYTRAYSSVAPTVFENGIDTFTESDIEFWKGKAETRFRNYTPGNGVVNTVKSDNGTTDTLPLSVQGGIAEETTTEDIPF